MKNHFPFHHLSELDNMMANIQAEGKEQVWQWMEEETDPYERCRTRRIYKQALYKLAKGK